MTDTDGHEAPGNGTGPGVQHQVNGSNDAEHLSDLSALFTGEDQVLQHTASLVLISVVYVCDPMPACPCVECVAGTTRHAL